MDNDIPNHNTEPLEKPEVTSDVLAKLEAIVGETAMSVLSELAPIFLDSATEAMMNLRYATGIQDGEGIRQAAHKLKGSSAVLGIRKLADLCYELENFGKAQQFDEAKAQLKLVEEEYMHVRSMLESYMQ